MSMRLAPFALSLLVCGLTACPKSTPPPAAPSPTKPVLLDYEALTPLPRASNHDYDVPLFSDAAYDPSITTPKTCLGHPVGAALAAPEAIVACFRGWAAQSPRVRIERYAVSHEGRELVRVIVTSPQNLARLDDIKRDIGRLADPRGLAPADQARIIQNTPAIALFGYSIHGDEVSGADASVGFGYHLIASTAAPVTGLLDDVVVIIDPVMNPDGRARTVAQVQQSASLIPNLNYTSMHRGHWPWGRGNHYLFDMNRDWIIGAAPETRGRWQTILTYNPQLLIDAHEMGPQDTYLFYPQSDPINPNFSPTLMKWQKAFAADHSASFDRYGWAYYTREWADGWFPGYSDAWGSLSGAIGILYEQSSTAGQPLRRASGQVVTYRESVHAQAVSSFSNLSSLARNRAAVLTDFVAFKRLQIQSNRRAFAIAPGRSPDREVALVTALMRQGIAVYRADAGFSARNTESTLGVKQTRLSLPQGTYVVPTGQPRTGLIRALLDFDVRLDAAFLQKEREKLERTARSELYDLTAWNLGQAFAVDAYWLDRPTVAQTQLTEPPTLPAGVVARTDRQAYAWLVDGRLDGSVAFAARAAERGLSVRIADEPFSASGRPFVAGSVLIRAIENPTTAGDTIAELAGQAKVQAVAVYTGLSATQGPDLGGRHFHLLSRLRIALVTNSPVFTGAFGHIWHHIDRKLQVPMTLLDAQYLGSRDLRRYNVIVLPPAGPLLGTILKNHAKRLREWLNAGGTLIAVGRSAAMLVQPELGLSQVRLRRDALTELPIYHAAADRDLAARAVAIDERAVWDGPPARPVQVTPVASAPPPRGQPSPTPPGEGAKGGAAARPQAPPAVKQQEEWMMRFSPRGAMLRGLVAPGEWLGFGAGEQLPTLVRGDHVLLARPPVRAIVRLAPAPDLRLSGLLWPEARERFEKSAYATVESVGAGQIVLFASPPSFRAATPGTARLLANALVYGPSLGASQPLVW